jgi:hypothetical protein
MSLIGLVTCLVAAPVVEELPAVELAGKIRLVNQDVTLRLRRSS